MLEGKGGEKTEYLRFLNAVYLNTFEVLNPTALLYKIQWKLCTQTQCHTDFLSATKVTMQNNIAK